MIHQPLGGTRGKATDIAITTEHILNIKDKLNHILAQNTGKDLEIIAKDTDRDFWMSADDAVKYGLIDKVVTHRD